MTEYKKQIRETMTDYLLAQLNARAAVVGLPTIEHVETGLTGAPGSSSFSPSLYIYVGERTLGASFFDNYAVQFAVAFGCSNPQEGEAVADKWEDVIEDIFRTDRSLGDSCLQWVNNPEITSLGEPGFWMSYCRFTVEVDLGGLS